MKNEIQKYNNIKMIKCRLIVLSHFQNFHHFLSGQFT